MQYSLIETMLNVSETCGMCMYTHVSVHRYFLPIILDMHHRYHKTNLKIKTVNFLKKSQIL